VGGTTQLSDATGGGVWSSGSIGVAAVVAGTGLVSGISAGTATITYTTSTGCSTTTPVTVNLLAPITGTTTICAGNTTLLADAAGGGVWSSSNPTVATIDASGNVYAVSGGVTTIEYLTPLGCSATTLFTVNPLPNIGNTLFTNPTTCLGSDGTIILNGLTAGSTYSVEYTFNGTTVTPVTIVATGATDVIITGLSSGTYTNIYVTDVVTGCVSNNVGPVVLTDPLPPPAPVINSNAPICIGQTLILSVTDAVQGGAYFWSGPNGYTSITQDTLIKNATTNNSGAYTVTYTLNNCTSFTTANIVIYPPLVLTNVTPSQTIPYGSSIQLNADGALYYAWTPNDGSISNPNINNPLAWPQITTVYQVVGTNLAGCMDTAEVVVTIDSTTVQFVPSAFTPNGDGLNDVFRITNINFQKLVEFNVYNRWGQLVYQNSYDPKKGWDGTYNGVAQDMGVYNYSIIVITAEGITKYYKGDVTLIR
jgi:gliding motility-associated-like protein